MLYAPSRDIVARSKMPEGSVVNLSCTAGLLHSDLDWCRPAVVAHAFTQADADAAADAMGRLVAGAEAAFDAELLPPRTGSSGPCRSPRRAIARW